MASADWYTSVMQSAAVCLVQKLLGAKEAGVLGVKLQFACAVCLVPATSTHGSLWSRWMPRWVVLILFNYQHTGASELETMLQVNGEAQVNYLVAIVLI